MWVILRPVVPACLALLAVSGCQRLNPLQVEAPAGSLRSLPADGRTYPVATLRLRFGRLDPASVVISGAAAGASIEPTGTLLLRAPVNPAEATLRLSRDAVPVILPLRFVSTALPATTTPGLPVWMPLHASSDREAFRRWFTAVADRAADLPPASLPREISDCSALLRYSFREALRAHDDKWYASPESAGMPTLPSVAQWIWPDTPLGPGLFRTRPGRFTPADLHDGSFSQFADAKTLSGLNTVFVSRSTTRARPGDLLFYRLLETDSQYHSMILTGAHAEWVVYHTGPIDGHPGTMRRVLLADLLHHPDPRWRPLQQNANFLGVYRWDILAEDPD